MNCKSIQALIATGGKLSPRDNDHLAACPACQGFARDLMAIEAEIPTLDTRVPSYLRSQIEGRFTRPRTRITWQAVTVSVAIVAIIATPLLQITSKRLTGKYVKGERLGSLPPFHAKISGWNHLSFGDKADGEVWFSGFALRVTSPTIDTIASVENGKVYQYWKPDGTLQKRISVWASRRQPLTKTEQVQMVNLLGPMEPVGGKFVRVVDSVPINVFGRDYQTRATTYQLPVSKSGSLTTVQTPTNEIVYKDLDSGRIVRIEFVVTFPGAKSQTETLDYDYSIPSDDHFETSTLRSTSTTSPAKTG